MKIDGKNLNEENISLHDQLNKLGNAGNEFTTLGEDKKFLERKIGMERRELTGKCNNGVNMWNGKYHSDGMSNGNKIKEEKENLENDVNMNKKCDEKQIKTLTEELEKLQFSSEDNGKSKIAETHQANLKKPELNSEKSSCHIVKDKSVEMKKESPKSPTESCPEDDIVSSMAQLDLESGTRIKEDEKMKKIDTGVAKFTDSESKSKETEPCLPVSEEGIIEIVTQPQRKGEENEDLEATCLLSYTDSVGKQQSGICQSLLARGPIGGIGRNFEPQDVNAALKMKVNECYWYDSQQPAKFLRPNVNNNHRMSGGSCVQIFQPSIPPVSPFNPLHYQYAVSEQQNFMYPGGYNNIAHQPVDDSALWSNFGGGQSNWDSSPHQQPYCEDLQSCNETLNEYLGGSDFQCTKDFSESLEAILGTHFNDPYHPDQVIGEQRVGSTFLSSQSPPMPTRALLQQSVCSPGDQRLTSPGSSPGTYMDSPRSSPSALTTTDLDLGDLGVLSPGEISISSPESGFVTDDASLDLELALEFINEDTAADINRGKLEKLPLIVAKSSIESDVINETVLPSAVKAQIKSRAGTAEGKRPGQQKRMNKTPSGTKREREVIPYSSAAPRPLLPNERILPHVGDGVLPAVFPPSAFNVNAMQNQLQFPCFVVGTAGNQPQQQLQTKHRPIKPKMSPEPVLPTTTTTQVQQIASVQSPAMPQFSPPTPTQLSPQESTVTSSSDQQSQLVKAYRVVAGLAKEKILAQDDDGDTILHMAIVKEETKFFKALLDRYLRDGLLDNVINLANKQHQTPICLAVFLNQTEMVQMLTERKADVNVQLQRKVHGELICYRLIHYAAKRGQKWVPTLIQLLNADSIELQAFDSEGCTALHCAIKVHGTEKIDSKETIYNLAMHGADLNIQNGLSGMTPLHYAIEKKDSDLVGWFLGLANHIQSSGTKRSPSSPGLVHSLLNAKPSGRITALQLALNLQMDRTERVKILELLLRYGAEVSQKSCDGKIRQELAKYPELAPLLKNSANGMKNIR